jgi:hypothetical protein
MQFRLATLEEAPAALALSPKRLGVASGLKWVRWSWRRRTRQMFRMLMLVRSVLYSEVHLHSTEKWQPRTFWLSPSLRVYQSFQFRDQSRPEHVQQPAAPGVLLAKPPQA